jgi:hypothetical protein
VKLKVPFVIVFLCSLLQHCGEPNEKEGNPLTSISTQVYVDTSIYTILPYDTSDHWVFQKANATSLSTTEIMKIEKMLQTAISEYNVEQRNKFDSMIKKHPDYELKQHNFISELKRYKRQYFPIVNEKGEKEVWVNCFCSTWGSEKWKSEIIHVKDGGNCFFNVKINLTKQILYELSVNGVV